MAPTFDSWVKYLKPNPQASLRLFCFTFAGGWSATFRTWPDGLPEYVETCAIELPGRGTRLKEIPLTSFPLLVEAIALVLPPHLDKPFAFFGHSMGGLICFEVARFLNKHYDREPVHLFASGCRSPQLPALKPPIHTLPEAAFLEELRNLNGTPQVVLENAELRQLLLPVLRADFAVFETYTYTTDSPLNCSITALGGLHDPEVSAEQMTGWREQTTASFSLHLLPGDHFFLQSAQPLLLQIISQKLHQLTSVQSFR
ncbi:thioesterase [Phormidesmis priestleyi ULC007]|uniref:Thioesterase n=1 Tax=Phormidesmis priestleyi ULC007 TaxID=1920490 RepID=A0A2T1DAY0_9CYAN|nr:thioesterase II family protein [Phormidesmis priestleyi]PSB17682.1 thioesterase [Phormidesmis priestleyi ULC007]